MACKVMGGVTDYAVPSYRREIERGVCESQAGPLMKAIIGCVPSKHAEVDHKLQQILS